MEPRINLETKGLALVELECHPAEPELAPGWHVDLARVELECHPAEPELAPGWHM